MKNEPAEIRVDLGNRAYTIQIGSGTLARFSDFLFDCAKTKHAIIITDSHVEPLYAEPLAEQLVDRELDVNVMTVEPGEPSKSPALVADLWQSMLDAASDRQSVVVAIGGGVVGDLAGFVAATFARGIRFVQVPTTLLAQVDSSVGGKTGVNLPEAKNIVGSFWQPEGVLIDVDALATLPEREFVAGLAEVVKYGVILDAEFFQFLEDHVADILAKRPAALQRIVTRSCRLKADIVEADEREETGVRSCLNYGHTFAHAFEATTGYDQLLHGEAVAMGMHCAARLAARLGQFDEALVERQAKLLSDLRLPTQLPTIDTSEALHLMRRDKKVSDGQMRFVLPTRIGNVELVGNVSMTDIRPAMEP